jgi:RND superfamily putative drug exporter
MTRWLRSLGGRCAAHPLVVVAGWLLVVVGVTTLSLTVGGRYSRSSTLPGTEVGRAEALLAAHLPLAANESADVVVQAADAAAATGAVEAVTSRIVVLPRVVRSPAPAVTWSADRTTALISVHYDVPRLTLGHGTLAALQRTARAAPQAQVLVGGSLARDAARPSGGLGEEVGIGVAVLVLLLVFGSVIAAFMPIATAAVAIITGLGIVKLLAGVYAFDDSAPQLATMMGLGVGVDYALFIVTRHREGLRSHLTAAAAATSATATAGSSVLWAGITVVAAICGLAFAGIPVVTSLGFAAAVVVACSVAASLTLLPALLTLAGRHIDRLHIPMPHLRHERAHSRIDPSADAVKGEPPPTWWGRWASGIERHPLPYLVGPVLLLAVLAIPVGGMRLGAPDASSAKHSSEDYKYFTMVSRTFGVGANAPLTLVLALPPGADIAQVTSQVRTAVAHDRDVVAVTPLTVSPDHVVGVMIVQPASGPQDQASQSLVGRLRTHLLPPVQRATGTRIYVSGLVAGRYDVGQRVLERLPWFVGAVLAVSFLLLMVVFRSLLVPLKAVVLNLLSIAAALGFTVAVFTWGWLRDLVGLREAVPLESIVPMLMFAIVFGLSMDYEVFLLSRVREEWRVGGDSRGSVVRGLTATARVISAAAAIMVSVFLAFTLSDDPVVKMIGLGLAVAVFLDATVIRLLLVPATMSLLGDLNWWLPRWLDRLLPHVDLEGAVPVTIPAAEPSDDRGSRQETEAPMARPTA